ncbi:MAG: bacteriohemerythrin [Gammaproteobacteria bacterium]|nr:bacteriohemerythrin [Gammaproteobacteria bacterium]
MNAICWDEGLSVSIRSLDDDHKHIIDLMNELDAALVANNCSEKLPGIVDKLVEYVFTHFKREEDYMQRIKFPGLERHQLLHEKLTSKLIGLKNQMDSRDTGFLSLELSEFLRNWLLDHIAMEDLQIRPFLEDSGFADLQDSELSNTAIQRPKSSMLGRLGLRQRIAWLAGIQWIGVLFLGGIILFGSWSDVSKIRTATRINELVPLAARVLTELQRERGLHSGMSRWGSSSFGQHLAEQQHDTDKALAAFIAAKPDALVDTTNTSMTRSIDNSQKRLSQLASIRQSSQSVGQTPRSIIEHYSPVIHAQLDLIDDIITLSAPEEARSSASAYSALLHLREFMGLERAFGSVLFGAESPNPDIVERIADQIAAQEENEQRFRLHAPDNFITLYSQSQASPVSREIFELRQMLLTPSTAVSLINMDPMIWFDLTTRNIDAVIDIEDQLLESLVSQTKECFNLAQKKLLTFVAIIALITLFIVMIENILARSIKQPLSELSQGMIKLANGDRMVRVTGVSRHDELGELARAFEIFRSNLIRTDLAISEDRVDFSNIEYEKRFFSHISQAVNQSPVSVVIADFEGRVVYVNQFYESITGYQNKEIVGSSLRNVLEDRLGKVRVDAVWELVADGEVWEGEALMYTKSGKPYWELIGLSSITSDSEKEVIGIVYIGQDISERKKQEEAIEYQAHHDDLTNLPNRVLMLDRLENAISQMKHSNKMLAVMFIDLDDFKRVNDSVGHHLGDELLVEAAKRLQNAVRASDTVARQGGDEFLILAPELQSQSDVETIAEKILTALNKPFVVQGMHLAISASIGFAFYPDDARDVQPLLSKADAAMYRAKADGGGTYRYFDASMNEAAVRRLSIEQRLCQALDSGDLYLAYQPLVNIYTGEIAGAEALLRWSDPIFGNISPEEFIPVAEQTGLIVPIGKWVLEMAATRAQIWRDRFHKDFKISVNVSPRQFHEGDFIKVLEEALEIAKLPTHALQLEVTEGLLVRNEEPVCALLDDLIHAGVSVVMDDFGTGYSSLSHLRKYPFDGIKIDKNFILDMTDDPEDALLVKATIAMGKSLDLKVTAEGVETQLQLNELHQMGCDFAQGYLFSPAVPAHEFESLLGASQLRQTVAEV